MAHDFVAGNARNIVKNERVVRVLQHRPVTGTFEVGEVLILVPTDALDVRVEALFPRAITRAARGLDYQLARIDPLFVFLSHLQPRLSPDGFQITL